MAVTLNGKDPTIEDLPKLETLYKHAMLAANEWREDSPNQVRQLWARRALAFIPLTAIYTAGYALTLAGQGVEMALFASCATLHIVVLYLMLIGAEMPYKRFKLAGEELRNDILAIREQINKLKES